ncbi:RrF2 family transcriptional regulator [Novisyntrophococcus fermenticellae]|uniref:RrF2 family transcriptional regulator n=1 Tax=Novisyntrophococcus fermenticellae TaxID=2068655 RepID=UPI001E2D71F6|nr:Rrf2 family transcriptional regulator [Novisyntrophococcus fermenticellae]
MRISTKGRYALRMMLDLALHDQGEPVRVKDIAAREDISIKYLEQIVALLVRAGYLKSIRGPQGGYRLVKTPKEYSLGSILRLTEGSLAPVESLEEDADPADNTENAATMMFWQKLNQAIKSVVDSYTLEDLMDWQMQAGDNYVI